MASKERILVIDDEKAICRNVEKILERNHYEVTKALSAQEALDKMAKESFALLISDIVMPQTNGLELLKMVKRQWPLTKVIMMTAYASTDTALKAIRLGALDYLPKPFTPEELRTVVEKALSGQLAEAPTSPEEREAVDLIDIDIPFNRDEVAAVTGESYVDQLGPGGMPVVEMPSAEPPAHHCPVGEMVCDIFKKLGSTCKAGVKTKACPQKKAKRGKAARKGRGETRNLIGVDQPFDYQEVVAVTGPEYVARLRHEGVVFVPYEELKQRVLEEAKPARAKVDEDIPFDRDEVAAATGEAYVDRLGPSDMPVAEALQAEPAAHYCPVGEMVCDIFKKLGSTCKAGVKTKACPQKKAKKKKAAKMGQRVETGKLIGPDLPFDYDEVVAATGPDYVAQLRQEGISIPYYETLKEREARASAGAMDRLKAQAVGQTKPRVLVVDDEVAVNNNVRKILTRKGFAVDQADTKKEALERIEASAYDLILLDLKMPGVKGLELLEAINERQPDTRVIIITGYATIETAVETARLGAVDLVPKPFTPAELRKAAEGALAQAA